MKFSFAETIHIICNIDTFQKPSRYNLADSSKEKVCAIFWVDLSEEKKIYIYIRLPCRDVDLLDDV